MNGNGAPCKGTKTSTWQKKPTGARRNEQIGGGWFVFRRGEDTGRVRASNWPFEHASKEAALKEAERLAAAFPEQRFEVYGCAGTFVSAALAVGEAA